MGGKPFDSDTDLAKAIRLLIDKSITTRPKVTTTSDSSEPIPSTSSAIDSSTAPPILPPNRTTVKGLRGLLLHSDYFSEIIFKSKV